VIDVKIYPAGAPRAAVVLAHGAGAGQASPFMVAAARGIASRGLSVATFDFAYMAARRKVPDPASSLERQWQEAIDAARAAFPAMPLFIGGKSMGGRIASHVAAQANCRPLAGLVFFGYPLHPPGKPHQRRDAHLPSITEPMLFIQGSRDTFGTASEIASLLPRLARATLYEVAGGDHSLKVPARAGRSAAAVFEDVLDAAVKWMVEVIGGPNGKSKNDDL
jgi:predicted alpha/beta-hydrolase family hydrolase